jgi:hypothetical protein
MEGKPPNRISNVVNVRCLGCNQPYAKPLGGGTVRANPGCPQCGYVGWVLTSDLARDTAALSRSAEDRPNRRSA